MAMTDPDHIDLFTDPVPPGATVAGQWWPPRWLEPDYLRSRIAEIDLLHVHFGFDTTPPGVLEGVCRVLAEHRVPLVVTVHDLQNPHLTDQALHLARLDVLVREASTVITLTDGAADAIRQRWRRRAVVLPHPHLLPLEVVGAARVPRARPVVAVHAKNLRANVDPWPILDCLVACDNIAVRIDFDDGALSSERAEAWMSDRLAQYAAAGVDVRVHPAFTDAELVEYLHEIDVLVLPYRFGTHSGWVEACYDAGVRTVVPDCRYFGEQQPSQTFVYGRHGFDGATLERAVERTVRQLQAGVRDVDHDRRHHRKTQRQCLRHETVRIYRRLIVEKNAA